jgi:rhamnose utilization protein RhaD (predicted bifunctional aldolase and dehydrogenase)
MFEKVKNKKTKILNALVELSHFLGNSSLQLTILGEGNSSAKVMDGEEKGTFLVKASGTCLETIKAEEFVHLKLETIMRLLKVNNPSDDIIQRVFKEALVDSVQTLRPSVETLLHAVCLNIDGVNFIGHTHPISVNILVCSKSFPENLKGRIYPDEIVVLGMDSVLISYTDPGVKLAQKVKKELDNFIEQHQQPPKVLYLQNHGLIALGSSAKDVKNITLTANKAAWIRIGASCLGGINSLTPQEIKHIAHRLDEKYRQNFLAGEK